MYSQLSRPAATHQHEASAVRAVSTRNQYYEYQLTDQQLNSPVQLEGASHYLLCPASSEGQECHPHCFCRRLPSGEYGPQQASGPVYTCTPISPHLSRNRVIPKITVDVATQTDAPLHNCTTGSKLIAVKNKPSQTSVVTMHENQAILSSHRSSQTPIVMTETSEGDRVVVAQYVARAQEYKSTRKMAEFPAMGPQGELNYIYVPVPTKIMGHARKACMAAYCYNQQYFPADLPAFDEHSLDAINPYVELCKAATRVTPEDPKTAKVCSTDTHDKTQALAFSQWKSEVNRRTNDIRSFVRGARGDENYIDTFIFMTNGLDYFRNTVETMFDLAYDGAIGNISETNGMFRHIFNLSPPHQLNKASIQQHVEVLKKHSMSNFHIANKFIDVIMRNGCYFILGILPKPGIDIHTLLICKSICMLGLGMFGLRTWGSHTYAKLLVHCHEVLTHSQKLTLMLSPHLARFDGMLNTHPALFNYYPKAFLTIKALRTFRNSLEHEQAILLAAQQQLATID